MQKESLETRINWWKWGIASLGAVLVTIYFGYFGLYLQHPPALDADKWGQFGDFFGGILNPLVAFAAFYWLTQSVKIQKTELELAREASQKSAQALEAQVQVSQKSVQISAMTALLVSIQSELTLQKGKQKDLEKFKPRYGYDPEIGNEDEWYEFDDNYGEELRDIGKTIGELEARRRGYEARLTKLVEN